VSRRVRLTPYPAPSDCLGHSATGSSIGQGLELAVGEQRFSPVSIAGNRLTGE